jgi:hypothetical protein
MSTMRVETAAGDLPLPPFEFTGGDGRDVFVASYGERTRPDEEYGVLHSMYDGWPRTEQLQVSRRSPNSEPKRGSRMSSTE